MKTLTIVVAIAAALITAAPAMGSVWSSSRVDAAASAIAGHPVHVNCDTDATTWKQGTMILGYTYAPSYTHTVWIQPRLCVALRARLERKRVDLMTLAIAMHTLTHEAVHQRGGVYVDCDGNDQRCEGRTDCLALKLDEQTAVRFFGFAPVVERDVTQDTHDGWTITRATRRNPQLDDIAWYQHQLHRNLPSQYLGGCR